MSEFTRITVSASDVIRAYRKMVRGEKAFKRQGNNTRATRLVGSWRMTPRHYGGTIREMDHWLEHGYKAEAAKIGPTDHVIAARRRKLRPAEEGELQVDLALSGFDQPFMEWTRRPSRPGLRISAAFNINWDHSPESVQEFGSWLRGVIEAVTINNYDIALEVVNQCWHPFRNDGYAKRYEIALVLKRENEAFDGTTWSAFVSPGGFRHLMFVAIILAADQVGETVTEGLGSGINPDMGLTFDPVTRHLRAASGGNFDAEQATEDMATALGMQVGKVEYDKGGFGL